MGEGLGAVLLRPLEDAVRDGDRIYAVIKGTMINTCGRTSSFSAPSVDAQAAVVAAALHRAGVHPRTVSYIEAHGSGTELGDPVEIRALQKAFEPWTSDRQFCAVGSIKTNIGHLESAAGVAGLIKLALQFKHRTLVPSLHADETNPLIDFPNTAFRVQQAAEPWRRPWVTVDGVTSEVPLRAGISSFGLGGANAHAVLEEYADAGPRLSGGLPDRRSSSCPPVLTTG